MSTSAKISVLTPSFNSGKYIEKAIESVLIQDYPNWEHIIIDGSSNDNTIAVLQKYSHLIWISEPDMGQSDAMNKAFEKSNGDIIVYLNADDTFEPEIFSKVASYFRENQESRFLVGNLNVLDSNNKLKYKHSPSSSLIEIFDLVNLKFPLNPVSYFYKREVQRTIGPFPLSNHYSMDYWFLLRAYHQFTINKIDIVMGNYVHTGENKSSSFVDGKTSLFRDLLDFLCEKTLIDKYKEVILSVHTHYLEELAVLREESQLKNSYYSNIVYRLERKVRHYVVRK